MAKTPSILSKILNELIPSAIEDYPPVRRIKSYVENYAGGYTLGRKYKFEVFKYPFQEMKGRLVAYDEFSDKLIFILEKRKLPTNYFIVPPGEISKIKKLK